MFPGLPHHVTQRGNHREPVFFCDGDYAAYLSLLHEHTTKYAVDVVAYCLMPNHVHHIVVPSSPDGMHLLFKRVHGCHAQRINRMRSQRGHLWQGRYFSSPMDSTYFINAVRYVELNPVRARMTDRAEKYPWSSAAAHCRIRGDLVVDAIPRSRLFAGIADWSHWLAQGVADEFVNTLRRNGSQNLPCGSAEFVAQLESASGRRLQFRPHGGPRQMSAKQRR